MRCGGGTRAPGGGRLLPRCGASGVGCSPTPNRPSLGRAAGACNPLPLGAGCVRVRNHHHPTARNLASWLWLRWRQHKGASGGGAPAWVWRVQGLGALPRPTARVWGVLPGPVTDWVWVRAGGAWGPVINSTACALASWLCALWGRHEGAVGGRLLPGRVASGVGCSLTPNRPSLGRAAGARYPLAVAEGLVGVGTHHQPHSARPCELALRCGGGTRAPRGGGSCLGVGCPG